MQCAEVDASQDAISAEAALQAGRIAELADFDHDRAVSPLDYRPGRQLGMSGLAGLTAGGACGADWLALTACCCVSGAGVAGFFGFQNCKPRNITRKMVVNARMVFESCPPC